MQNLNGWKVLVFGALLVVLGAVYGNHGGMWPGANLLTGSGAIVLALGGGLVLFGSRVRFHLDRPRFEIRDRERSRDLLLRMGQRVQTFDDLGQRDGLIVGAQDPVQHLGQRQQPKPVAIEPDPAAEVSSIDEHRRQVRLAFRRRRRVG